MFHNTALHQAAKDRHQQLLREARQNQQARDAALPKASAERSRPLLIGLSASGR